ncbi:4-alpha-glucanotransferase [Stakelama sp. CBK3Z-3]|uniref:4-alpha-glucanotransferase n=1 Tax=Stakelama flava TaxID=2860338 RepID=A0ABS6XGB4_9SPHN|nr:4-alpha-glucanotransferase [Stakelama flava]MBW4329272.1 4-alpha-glucanotransferase [Stakelama flava]
MTPLYRLAIAAGLQIDWEDAAGKAQRVSDNSLRRILIALGHPAETDVDIERSLTAIEMPHGHDFITADVGESFSIPGDTGREIELELEDGYASPVSVSRTAQGLRIGPIMVPGYHRLHLGGRTITLAIAPERCPAISDFAPDRRAWGAAVQVPALRDEQPRAFGDFASLASSARAFASKGADAMAISPTHALFPADPSRFSPYAPSSRLFHNILFGDPALAGGEIPPTVGGDLIDWEAAVPERLAALRTAFAGRSEAIGRAVFDYRKRSGRALERHATFDALHTHFFAQGSRGWQDWPSAYHDPDGEAVAAFARDHAHEIDFYAFAQWLAEESLQRAQSSARDAGMAIGLISDLAVGMDGGGSHAWSRPEDLLTGLSIGAPPDPLGPQGQDWGIAGFAPDALRRTGFRGFIDTLRAAIGSTGGIRIDHVLGLSRLWVVPHGARSAEGAYLTMPLDDMLRLIALEATRANAIVIGEDLGTVPEGLRPKLARRGLMGMRVLWFERDEDGAFLAPDRWQADAVAMTGTHDTPTAAGWWQGRDIDWRDKLGATQADSAKAREDRADERDRLWQAFSDADIAEGSEPEPTDGAVVANAALAFVGATPCKLAIVPLEDVAALVEQPNLPGTTDEHPNWRRRAPQPAAMLLNRPDIAARVERLNKERRT